MNTGWILRIGAAGSFVATTFAAHANCGASGFALRVGAHDVMPVSATSLAVGKVGVRDRIGPTFNLDYWFCGHYVVDLLGSLPYTHDLTLNGSRLGSTQHLPPTLSIQYHPLLDSRFDPFFGVGVNHTMFRNESIDGGGATLKLDNTWGFAAQLGIDWLLTPKWFIGVDGRFIQIEPKAHLNGGDIGTVKINPTAVGFTLGHRF